MNEIMYEHYNVNEAIEFLHKLFYKRKGTDNIQISRVISMAYLKRPFCLKFLDDKVIAVIDNDSFKIYNGRYEMGFREFVK